jgi:hypothetical protein
LALPQAEATSSIGDYHQFALGAKVGQATYDENSNSKISSTENPESPGRQPPVTTCHSHRENGIGENSFDYWAIGPAFDSSSESVAELPVIELSKAYCDGIFGATSQHEERGSVLYPLAYGVCGADKLVVRVKHTISLFAQQSIGILDSRSFPPLLLEIIP